MNVFSVFSVQSRGKALLNALNSLQQLDKALDRFLAWLSETESALELLETEEEKYGPRDDFHRSHGCHDQVRVSAVLRTYLCMYAAWSIIRYH